MTVHAMDPNKMTTRRGRWYLRHGRLDEETYVTVVSAEAPEGTVARHLQPETIEITYDGESDEIALSVVDLQELLTWPPASTAQHTKLGPS